MGETSVIRDAGLVPSGQMKIDWVSRYMPVLNEIRHEFEGTRPFAGIRIGLCIHLEAKTAYFALTLQAAGAQVAIAGSNPLSTQDDVAAALAAGGVGVFAWHGATAAEYDAFLGKVLDTQPHLIMDDGGDLVSLLHTKKRDLAAVVYGGTEETTTGVLRLKAMERDGALLFPMLAVNDALSKYLFDNRYGTGQSVWDGIMRNTNLVVAGKQVVVVGYGWCGKGVAMRARGLGARVVVCEVDPIAANEALMDGNDVMSLEEAAKIGDIFVTVTGCSSVLRGEHFQRMKDGAILANAGHFDVEISKPDLAGLGGQPRRVRANVDEYRLKDGRRIYLLAEGRLVNLAGGDGHPAEIMDMSFALQALSLKYMLENHGKLEKKVYRVDRDLDEKVAALRLRALGVTIDELTHEQARYLRSWQV